MIDVIIPSYNDYRILNTVKSIKDYESIHSLEVFKIIIIDSNSDINLINEIRKITSDHDIIVSEKDNGIFDAINKGINLSSNEYIWWIGSDDLMNISLPIELINLILNDKKIDCFNFKNCYFNKNKIRRSSSFKYYSRFYYILGLEISHFATIWRRSFINDLRFDLKYKNAADFDFFYTLIVERNANILNFNRTLSFMREGGKTSKNLDARKTNYYEIARINKIKNKYLFYLIPTFVRIGHKLFSLSKYNISKIDKHDFISLVKYL